MLIKVLIPWTMFTGQGQDLAQYNPQRHQCDVCSKGTVPACKRARRGEVRRGLLVGNYFGALSSENRDIYPADCTSGFYPFKG